MPYCNIIMRYDQHPPIMQTYLDFLHLPTCHLPGSREPDAVYGYLTSKIHFSRALERAKDNANALGSSNAFARESQLPQANTLIVVVTDKKNLKLKKTLSHSIPGNIQ